MPSVADDGRAFDTAEFCDGVIRPSICVLESFVRTASWKNEIESCSGQMVF